MAEKITTLAYNSGVNYFDTSEFYSEGQWVLIFIWLINFDVISVNFYLINLAFRAERKLGKILKSKGWRYGVIIFMNRCNLRLLNVKY